MTTISEKWWHKYQVELLDQESGQWRIEHFVIGPEDYDTQVLRTLFTQGTSPVPIGRYTCLKYLGRTVMSDTPDEIKDHLPPVHQFGRRGGHALVAGLGIGMVTKALLGEMKFSDDSKVTVIEKSPDVIKMVAPVFQSDLDSGRLEIIEDDIFEWKSPRGSRYSVAWYDIWDSVHSDNLPEMTKLHSKFARKVDWQDSWAKEDCKSSRRRA